MDDFAARLARLVDRVGRENRDLIAAMADIFDIVSGVSTKISITDFLPLTDQPEISRTDIREVDTNT